MDLKCKDCKNLEICRYASQLKEVYKQIDKTGVKECPLFSVEIKCSYFSPKSSIR